MIHWNNSMNINEVIPNRNDSQTRMRPYNDNLLPNYYPLNIGMPQLMYNYPTQVMLTPNGSYTMVNNTTDSSVSDQSGIVSPSIDSSSDRLLYRIATWQDIAEKYEGSEQRPKCGKLNNNVYFTQRATSSDVYMLFDRKADYINNFVNYYFSDKNLARDQKLVALMDDKGIIPLSALIKFPKLHQIDSTIDDLIKAFQSNAIVMAVDINGEKGAVRRDKWCLANSHKPNPPEKQSDGINENLNNNLVADQSHNIIHSDILPAQNQQVFYFNPSPIYTQQPGMISNAANLGTIAQFQPYQFLSVNPPFPNNPTNQTALNPQQSNSGLYWHIPSQDYANQNLIQPMPLPRFNTNGLEAPGNRLN